MKNLTFEYHGFTVDRFLKRGFWRATINGELQGYEESSLQVLSRKVEGVLDRRLAAYQPQIVLDAINRGLGR